MKRFVKIHHSFFKTMGVTAGVIAALILFAGVFGFSLCAVQTGSMEPAIPAYSMCLVRTNAAYDGLEAGDIVVYTRGTDNSRIIHRVTALTPDGAVTKGDANQSDDGVSVTAGNLYARYIGHIPYVAHFYNLIHSQYGVFLIAGLVALLFALDCLEDRQANRGRGENGQTVAGARNA